MIFASAFQYFKIPHLMADVKKYMVNQSNYIFKSFVLWLLTTITRNTSTITFFLPSVDVLCFRAYIFPQYTAVCPRNHAMDLITSVCLFPICLLSTIILLGAKTVQVWGIIKICLFFIYYRKLIIIYFRLKSFSASKILWRRKILAATLSYLFPRDAGIVIVDS